MYEGIRRPSFFLDHCVFMLLGTFDELNTTVDSKMLTLGVCSHKFSLSNCVILSLISVTIINV